ncbi:MAG: DoxX family membrane protein [Rhizobiales bacterium]|nr:DoxX family membrane protein [Hyphomicrobiales bacterium]
MQDATIAAAGRLLMAILFLLSGLSKLAAPAATMGYIASAGLPFPVFGYVAALGVELGSLLLLAGFHARIAAAILAAFTVAAGLAFHSNFADQNEMIHFLKNVALAGGLLQVVAFGAGSFSLDARRVRIA